MCQSDRSALGRSRGDPPLVSPLAPRAQASNYPLALPKLGIYLLGPVESLLALVSGNLQTFYCYGLVTNWQFFACGARFVGRSPRTPPTDVCYPIGGAREKAAKNGWILPGQGTQPEISRLRNILSTQSC